MKQEFNVTLPCNFETRDYQRPFFEAMKTKKRAVLVWARRNGKDKTCWNFLIKEAAKKVGIYNYYAPSYKQGKKIIWENIDKSGFKLLNHIPKDLIEGTPNNTELKVRLKNGSLIQIIGTDNPDALVGANPAGCVFTEASLQKPEVWDLIRPILAENGGWAVFNGTPRGANWFKDLFDMAKGNPSWFAQLLTADDTGFPSIEDIEEERKAGMSEDMIQQEFYCSWTLGVEGAYYAKHLYEAREEDRIGNVVWERQKRVYTAWDIGYGDSTAIVFYQIIGNEIHVIDYYENSGEGLPHYADVLFRKPYLYAEHYAPHDIDSHAFSSGLSAKEVGASLGIKFIPLPTLKLKIEDGIEAVRSIFPRVCIDEKKCERLIKCLENYRKEYDEDRQIYKTRPLHNWASHGCFTGETLVSTLQGSKRIDEIKVGDLVLTPNGYKKVIHFFEYESKELLKLKTTNSELTCTPNHKIFSENGLVHADALRYNDRLFNKKSRLLCKKKYGSTLKGQGLGFRDNFISAKTRLKSSSMDIGLNGGEIITDEQKRLFTPIQTYKGLFGLFIMGIFLKTTTYITKTEIPEIMTSAIWSLLTPLIILSFMEIAKTKRSRAENRFTRLWNMLKSGMLAKKESNGIKNMQKKRVLENFKFLAYAKSAIKILLQKFIIKNTARQIASQKQDENLFVIMKNATASFVKRLMNAINMQKKERVVSVVQLNLSKPQKVYDIEVEDDHCYYANNVLVSNSDAFRYLAIAVKIHVDGGKVGVTDAEADKLYNLYHPTFNS